MQNNDTGRTASGSQRAWKRLLLGVLAALNGVLAVALLTAGGVLPQAFGQTGARGGNYLSVTAKPAGQNYDVLYVLDQNAHRLHAFYRAQPQNRQMTRAESRDLKKDFGG